MSVSLREKCTIRDMGFVEPDVVVAAGGDGCNTEVRRDCSGTLNTSTVWR